MPKSSKDWRFPKLFILDLISTLPRYIFWRLAQGLRFVIGVFEVFTDTFSILKRQVVSRMFWGRGEWYRRSFHLAVFVITGFLLISGILSSIGIQSSSVQSLDISYGQQADFDLLEQGGSLNAVLALEPNQQNYKIFRHAVAEGETLDALATKYGVSKDTIRWANSRLISAYSDDLRVGWQLEIPEINGVWYELKANDNLDSVVSLTNGNKFDIIELNELQSPEYSIAGKQRLFIPSGKLPPPPPLVPQRRSNRRPLNYACSDNGIPTSAIGSFPAGAFGDPLCSPDCVGYGFNGGFTAWHKGVDLGRGGGCTIKAIGPGTVTYAGWNSYGGGYAVVINHGDGITSHYMHGDGNMWVRVGDSVGKGQDLMYMGTTGNSSAVHLHLSLRVRGVDIDPAPYVPYRR